MISKFEHQYQELLVNLIYKGVRKKNRTGVDTLSLFSKSLNIDLKEGFPILTGKKIFYKKAKAEFEWMLSGDTSLSYLHKNKVFWWDSFAENNNIGKSYGYQLRNNCGYFDQWEYCKKEILANSRRAVISLWQPTDFNEKVLPPCYTTFVFYKQTNKLSVNVTLRSSDVFLGLPYDIVVFALMLKEMANECNLEVDSLFINLVDAHLYQTHIKAAWEYIKADKKKLPMLSIENNNLIGYNPGKFIKADLIK